MYAPFLSLNEDRLINVKKNGAFSAHYTYDADGRRVRSVDRGGVIDYVYSGLNVIDEVCGGAHEKHVYAGGMHIASNSSGTVEYYHVDHLGSTRLKTNSTGSVIYESNYEPYGPGCCESDSEDYRYTGKQEDPTGLYYFGARYYDPVTGRFTTRDTVMGDLADPQSLNRYSYCRNNPHKYTDPDGHDLFLAILACSYGYMSGVGIYEGVTYYLETGDVEGAWNRGLIAFDTAGAEMLLAVPATLSGVSPTIYKPAVNVLGGWTESQLEREGYETDAAGIEEYHEYDVEDFTGDVLGGFVEGYGMYRLGETLPKDSPTPRISYDTWKGFKKGVEEWFGGLSHMLWHHKWRDYDYSYTGADQYPPDI